MQQTFVASGLKTSSSATHVASSHVHGSGSDMHTTTTGKTIFHTTPKSVPVRQDTHHQQQQQQTDTAQLLLSLSGTEFPKQTFHTVSKNVRIQHGVSSGAVTVEPSRSCPLESSVGKNKEAVIRSEVIDRVPVVTPNGGVKPASVVVPTQQADKGKEHPAVPEKIVETAKDDHSSQMLFVEDGPCKRGRPMKRQMNLVFQEKVLTDAEVALQKEAEASRKALEMLQQEMSIGDETPATGVTQSIECPQQKIVPVKQISSKGPATQSLNNIVTASPRILRKEPVAATKLVSAKTDIVTQVSAPEPSSQSIINQVAGNAVPAVNSGSDETNIVYHLEEGVIAGQDSSNATNIVYQVADNAIVSGQDSSSQNIIYQVADNTGTTAEGSNNTNIIYQVADNSNAGSSSAMSQYMEVLREAGLPADVPILLESSDGSYVTVNEEVLMSIMNGGIIQVGDGSIVGGEGVQFIVQEVQEVTEGQVEAAEASTEQIVSAEMNATKNIVVNEQTQIKEGSGSKAESSGTIETDTGMIRPFTEQTNETCGKEGARELPSLERNEAMDIKLATSQPENTAAIASSGIPVQHEANQMVTEEAGGAADSTPMEVDHGVMPQSATEPPSHSDEIITGDGYGEEAMEGFAVSDTKENVGRTGMHYRDSDTTGFTFAEQTCSDAVENKSFPVSESEKAAEIPENGGMSVEQALQAMMGEGSDTEMEVCANTDADGTTKVRPIISHHDTKGTQNEGSVDEENDDLRLVLSPDDDSVKVEEERQSTGEGSVNDSFTLALSSPDSTGNDKTLSEAENVADSAEGGQRVETKSFESENDNHAQINADGVSEVKDPCDSTLTSVHKCSGSVGVDISPDEASSVKKSENSNSIEINRSGTDVPRMQAVADEVDTVPVEMSSSLPLQSNSDLASETKSHEAASDVDIFDKTKQSSESDNILSNKSGGGDDGESTKIPTSELNSASSVVENDTDSNTDPGKEVLSETNTATNVGFSSDVGNVIPTDVDFDCSNPESSFHVSGKGDDKSLPVKVLTDPVIGIGDKDVVDEGNTVNELFDSSKDALSADASVLEPALEDNTHTELPVAGILDSFLPGAVQQDVTRNVVTDKQDRQGQDIELNKEGVETYVNSDKGIEGKETAEILCSMSDPEKKPKEDCRVDSESSSRKSAVLVENQDDTDLTLWNIKTGENALQTPVEGSEGAVSSPSKDIPYAVGLLPLRTALEKLQAMPEYHPRKTRSASSGKESGGEVPPGRLKRKASSSAENLEKKMKPCDADDGDGSYDSEGTMVMAGENFDGNTMLEACIAEDSKTTLKSPSTEESLETVAVESKMEPLLSTMELVSDSGDAV